jgi:serine/threonine protein kinase
MEYYNIVKKIGSGAFANIYLADKDNQQVALKISKSNISKWRLKRDAAREVHILKKLRKSDYNINMIEAFYDINCDISYITMELLSNDVYTLLRDSFIHENSLLPLKIVKRISKQILQGLEELSRKAILHNDLKVENILITKPLEDNIFHISKSQWNLNFRYFMNIYKSADLYNHSEKYYEVLKELFLSKINIKICDFGNSISSKILEKKPMALKNAKPTRYVIAPEILIKAPYWLPADMWAFGCLMFELLTGKNLFEVNNLDNNMGVNSKHLAFMQVLFGPYPAELLKTGIKSKKYYINNIHKFNYLIRNKVSLRYTLYKNGIKFSNLKGIMSVLNPIFVYNPESRITPSECLKITWFKDVK